MSREYGNNNSAADGSPSGSADTARSRLRPRWIFLLVTAALAAAALLCDQIVTDSLTADATRAWIERRLDMLAGIGIYVLIIGILAAFPNRWRLCVGFLIPVILSTTIVHLLKWLIGRARPRLDLGTLHFEPLAGAEYCDAFPSGHTASAAVVALLLGTYFPRARWVFYFYAGLFGLERIINDWHFLSDVLAGYAVGALVVFMCIHLLGPRFYEKGPLPPRERGR